MRQIQKGSVDRSVDLYIIDSTDGTPEVGVLWNTAGIDLKYRRDLSAVVSITEATLAALTTAHTDGGFLEIGNGVYRLDLPDAAWATGADHVTIFGTVTGMIVLPVTVQLVGFDPEALTWLTPTTAGRTLDVSAGGEAGIDWANIGSPTTAQNLSGTNIDVDQVVASVSGTVATVTNLTNLPAITANWLTAAGTAADFGAELATAIWTDTTASDFTTALSVGKSVMNGVALGTGLTVNAVTGLTASNLDATISSRATPAQVNTEVVDALNVDTYAEPAQGAPAATATLAAKINYLYKAWRNKKTQTSTTFSLFADDATTVDQKATVSDDATTATIGEIATGP